MAQGTYEGIVVEKRSRTIIRSHYRNRSDAWTDETFERIDTKIWVENCGCFVSQTTEERHMATKSSPALIKALEARGADGVDEANRLRRREQAPPGETTTIRLVATEFR
jgi:hypothetical protein